MNFLASHDGFTLADTTRYSRRHNEANTENNRDGHHSNFSDNAGVEGDSTDAEVREIRARRQRNMLATLFLSQGTPMLLAGDEFANSQKGNNNAYCQDNDIGWLNWDQADTELQSFVSSLSAFRQDHVCLRQSRFLHGAARPEDGLPDVVWMDFDGQALEWRDPRLANLCLLLRRSAEMPDYAPDGDAVFIVFNRKDEAGQVALPKPQEGHHWVRCIDTDQTRQDGICISEQTYTKVTAQSVAAFVQKPDGSGI